jgi:hypothetical protein
MSETAKDAAAVDRFFRPDPFRDLRVLLSLCELVATFTALPVQVFLHRRFGERYLNVATIMLAAIYLALFSTIAGLLGFMSANSALGFFLLHGFATLFLLVTFAHWLAILWRSRKGERWHSYSAGLPLPFWRFLPVREETVVLYVEPALVFLLGFLFRLFATSFGEFLVLAGASLFVKGQLLRWRMRQRVLDVIDGQIEQAHLAAALVEDRPARETEGFVVYGAALGRQDRSRREAVAVAMGSLDPELSRMLEAQKEQALSAGRTEG